MNRIYSFVIAVLLLSACDSKLDLRPIDQIDNDKAFQTIEQVEKGVIGVYATLSDYTTVNLNDKASDDLRLSSVNTGQGVQIHNWTFTPSTGEFNSAYSSYYHTIDRVNRMLPVIDKFNDYEQSSQYKGELLFIRAFSHYKLVNLFCANYADDALGLPYMKTSIVSEPSRISQKEFYTEMMTDLDESLSLIGEDFNVLGRSNMEAIYALKAKIALNMKNWTGAINFSTKAIEGDYKLISADKLINVWKDSNENNEEVIFKLLRNAGGLGSIYNRTENENVFYRPAVGLKKLYTDDDVRIGIYFGLDNLGNEIVTKHIGRVDGLKNVTDMKIFRVSEMYLLRAEAYVGKKEYQLAKIDINKIRENRNAIVLKEDASDSDIELGLKIERRKELAYEGHRFNDLKRWEDPLVRNSSDTYLTVGKRMNADDYRWVFPIPQQELRANKNMRQNLGYENTNNE